MDLVAVLLAVIHVAIPLLYYMYAKHKWLPRSWGVRFKENWMPRVSILLPVYNEAELIQGKLDNIKAQEYPRNRMEVIVVDSASTDGTADKVTEWIKRDRGQLDVKIIREPERRGKAHALNTGLAQATGEVIVITDADALWPSTSTLAEAVKWLSDPVVGAVSCTKKPHQQSGASIEQSYRQYYNILRLAESKAWSTPIFHGEFAAYKKDLLLEIGGFPEDIGADDSYTATMIAYRGRRAIIPETIECTELVPPTGYHEWRIRRAQHLLQHFAKTLLHKTHRIGSSSVFRRIVAVEAFIHLVNPWLLAVSLALLVASLLLYGSLLALALIAMGTALLAVKPYRTWIASQVYLLIAAIRNTYSKELVWKKQSKTSNRR